MTHAQLEVIAAAFEAATHEMAASLVRTAFSPNIKERADCSTALCDAEGRALSLMTNAPAHLGSTLRLVPALLSRFPLETLRPGDAFLANDPYIVGVTHLNDCTVATPIFHDGRLVAFAAAVAHHSDVGGRVPGSEAGDSVSIFQEGIRVPPVQIYAGGARRADIVELFLLNSRMPHYSEGDLMAQMASCARGAARVQELFAKYGVETMLARIAEMLDATERRVRNRIRSELKEGTYSAVDWLDEDGVSDQRVRLAVTLTVKDGHLSLDLSGSSPQLGSGKNVPLTHSYATAYFCLKSVVDPFVPTNEGLYRTVSITAPEGLVVNPVAPAAVSSRNMTSMILAEAINNALGQAAPSRGVAAGGPGQGCISAGSDPASGRYFINYENLAGGQGARCSADGMDVVMINMTNTSNLPIEAMEIEFPVRIERYELIPDSGGAGRYRGGLGVLRDMRVLADSASVSLRSARQRFPAPGLAGGRPGGLGAFIRNPGQANETRLGLTTSGTPLANGDVLRVMTPGGGGYGEPSERDPEAVSSDLREGKITEQAAREIYGHEPQAPSHEPEPNGLQHGARSS
ncbi:MAG TPA: hydantoinase B/oxoprolinase family protein [Burkholderiales bacterium]|nr:hydantoinase B/oxoprolinase family protein [Burkholderiales bacterium]